MDSEQQMFYLVIVCHRGGRDPIQLCHVDENLNILAPVTRRSFRSGAILVLTDTFDQGAAETIRFRGTKVLVPLREMDEIFGGIVRLTITYNSGKEYLFTDRASIAWWKANKGELFQEITATVKE
jgi:hypothetical protein